MCFSATGSFVSAGILTGIGVASLRRNSWPPLRMFAAIPLLFAAQQFTEGIVWLTLDQVDKSWPQQLAVNVFLGFALVIWPAWLPLSLRRVERDPARGRVLTGLLCIGVAVAAYAALMLARWQPAAQMAGHSIRYVYRVGRTDLSPGVCLAAYVIPTVVPFFVSSISLTRAIGVALTVSLVVVGIVERDVLTSVWCFFAAILSGIVMVAVMRERRRVAAASMAA